MPLSAVDCLHRGLFNLRANWELVLVQWLQVATTTVLSLVGLLPLLAVVGWASPEATAGSWEAARALDSWAELLSRGRQAWVLLVVSLVIASAIWLIAMVVFCYLQGGILGLLMAADRQAPPGRPSHWRGFRAFSLARLRGWAGRYVWRYFWLLQIFFLVALAWLLLPLAVAALTAWGQSRWGGPAAVGIGCGGALPVVFSLVLLAFWLNLAQADLARQESGVGTAAREALRILGRRFGAVGGIFGAAFLASLFVTLSAGMVSLITGLGAGRSGISGIVASVISSLLQWMVGSAVGVAMVASLIGLVRSESRPEAGP